jgi:hypothetical protein
MPISSTAGTAGAGKLPAVSRVDDVAVEVTKGF